MSEDIQQPEEVVSSSHTANDLDNISQIEHEFEQAKDEALEAQEAKIQAETPKKEYTDIEKKAMEQGWKPEDQFDKSKGRRFVSAEEFIERGDLFSKIESQKNEVQHLKKVLKDLGAHLKGTEEAAYQKALLDLDKQRHEAIKQSNIVAFQEAERQMLEAHKYKQQLENTVAPLDTSPPEAVQAQQPIVSQDAKEFLDRNNTWFNTNSPENQLMCREAELIEQAVILKNPHVQEKDLLLTVEKEIQKRYPHRFDNPKREAPATVAPRSAPVSAKPNAVSSLTPRQRTFGEELVKYGVYDTLEAYAVDCKKQENIK